jgi:hypothetical protein
MQKLVLSITQVVELVDTPRLNRGEQQCKTCSFFNAPVVELVDTQDLKSCDPQRS